MILLLPLFAAAALPPEACHGLDGDAVLARDVAPFISGFAALPQDFLLGYVPASGGQRIFQASELERIAKNRGIDVHELGDICFVRKTFVPAAEQIREAMNKTLGIAQVKVEILSSSDRAVPTGELVFPRSGVQATGIEVTWNGYVQSREGAKYPVWARARIAATVSRVVATADLEPHKAIEPSQLRIESAEASPFDDGVVQTIEEAAGSLPKLRIPKAAALRKSQIEPQMDVSWGDLVHVEVFEGGAHLTLEGRAQTPGMKGTMVTIRNLASGKDFRAEVTGKDHVMVGGKTE